MASSGSKIDEAPFVLARAHLAIGLLHHGDKERFLADEVVVEQILADVAFGDDLVDTGAVVAMLGEMLGGDVEQEWRVSAPVRGRGPGADLPFSVVT